MAVLHLSQSGALMAARRSARRYLLALSPLALALCTAAFQPALLHRAHRPARAHATASRSTAAARLQPTSPFPRQQPARRKRRRRRTGPEIETMVVKTVALAVAGGALRSVVPSALPLASLTFVAGLVLRVLPTGTIEVRVRVRVTVRVRVRVRVRVGVRVRVRVGVRVGVRVRVVVPSPRPNPHLALALTLALTYSRRCSSRRCSPGRA